ncbi:hypothetical protein L0244_14475 [bacterium]|nr:hypothetical protein [bacterium]
MNRKDLVLAALSPAEGAPYRPVQVQKLLFLIDRKIPELVGGPHFDFKPYNYGPFDRDVYLVLESLKDEGYVDFLGENTWTDYKLTHAGQMRGEEVFNSLDEKAQEYLRKISSVVRKLTFAQLVSAIYREFPDMRVNSVFTG